MRADCCPSSSPLQTRGRVTARGAGRRAGGVGADGLPRHRVARRRRNPVYAERGPAGGYRLLDGFRTRLNGLTADEADSAALRRPARAGPAELGLGAVVPRPRSSS
ncbi:hypothetical protein ACU686_08370 [Yinghuangia aomiensis]